MPTPSSTLNHLYQELAALSHYSPSPRVNALFTDLVRFVLDPKSQNTLSAEQMHRLQSICSAAECHLEAYWAERITSCAEPEQELTLFPYLENYKKLTALEWSSLRSCMTHTDHKILFVGGGPLPLTAILLAQQYGQQVAILDRDTDACAQARALVRALGLEESIAVIEADAQTFTGYGTYTVIMVAALAGLEEENKEQILRAIRTGAPADAHILARSSWGMRELLYPPLTTAHYNLFTPLLEVRPQDDVINSVVIFANKRHD